MLSEEEIVQVLCRMHCNPSDIDNCHKFGKPKNCDGTADEIRRLGNEAWNPHEHVSIYPIIGYEDCINGCPACVWDEGFRAAIDAGYVKLPSVGEMWDKVMSALPENARGNSKTIAQELHDWLKEERDDGDMPTMR